MPSIRKNPAKPDSVAPMSVRRRLVPAEREQMIVQGAIEFFSRHGLGGQLRDLASGLGITHTLLYHYFPTKQALIERVYADLFEGRWCKEWEGLMDDKSLELETKLTRFYTEYANTMLERDWVRIFVFSGLSDRYITDRYFALLGEKLFPRIVRESRRYKGSSLRGKPRARELEMIMGLHGSIFYMGMRRWIYGQPIGDSTEAVFDENFVHDRVRGYVLALPDPSQETSVLPIAHPSFATPGSLSWPFH